LRSRTGSPAIRCEKEIKQAVCIENLKESLVRVVAADGAVSITCSDHHIAIAANAAATVLEPGAVALSAISSPHWLADFRPTPRSR
jgi:hypothetical protein